MLKVYRTSGLTAYSKTKMAYLDKVSLKSKYIERRKKFHDYSLKPATIQFMLKRLVLQAVSYFLLTMYLYP